MEDSLSSSRHNKAAIIPDDDEESGWTAYFEDFSTIRHHQTYNACSSSSSSILSDASSPDIPLKLSFKKTRIRQISYMDDSLVDTATSPLNSPKVRDSKSIDVNLKNKDDHMKSFKGAEEKTEERNEKNEYRELKKRGLCLVPFSMLVNYHA